MPPVVPPTIAARLISLAFSVFVVRILSLRGKGCCQDVVFSLVVVATAADAVVVVVVPFVVLVLAVVVVAVAGRDRATDGAVM